jgi:propionyl-CoA carboxylase alpha chain
MRVVESEADFELKWIAPSVKHCCFGDGSVLSKNMWVRQDISKSAMADSHGNVLYLFERECSIQRRHQK